VTRQERVLHHEDCGHHDGEEAHRVLHDEEVRDTFHVGDDTAAFREHGRQAGETTVEKDHLRDGLRCGSTVLHGDADVGLLQGKNVVHTVTCHGDDLPA